ncbi:MAG: hypothetical protein NC489_46785 [Ruminococcus flavefaciens]|nr:hypothetical protein [Ruminococcus flavefaciens]
MGDWKAVQQAYFPPGQGRNGGSDMTNGDRVRKMADAELAAFLVSDDAKACTHCKENHTAYGCHSDICCTLGFAAAVMQGWLSEEAGRQEGQVTEDGNAAM